MIKRAVALSCLAAMLGLTGCGEDQLRDAFDSRRHDFIDRKQELSRDDYLNMAAPRAVPKKGDSLPGDAPTVELKPVEMAPPIPDVSQILAAPRPPKIGQSQIVSIAVTDDVPLKDVLIELARLADVDIELDAGIMGGISFRAKEKPFNEVIERISNLAGLRYNMRNGVLRVERDVAYVKSYPLDFLNIDRSSQSNVNISTNVLSSSGGDSGSGGSGSGGDSGGGSGGSSSGGLNTGSTSTITSSTNGDFWQSLDSGLKEILNYVPVRFVSQQVSAPLPASTAASGGFDPQTGAPIAAPVAIPAPPTGAAPAEDTGKTFYIMNRQAGILTISATERQHEMVRLFLEKIERSASAQVLIEAKIVEVTLKDEFESGIDWSILRKGFRTAGADGTMTTIPDTPLADFSFGGVSDPSNLVTFKFNDDVGLGLDAVVKLAERFGTTRTLSSPRLHAINNQQAVLTFAENQVYFQLNVEQSTTTAVGNTTSQTPITVNSEIKTVPIGIILTIQPSINMDTNEVTLSVRPTLSRITGTVPDPAVAYLISQTPGSTPDIQNNVPIVEVRELDSILKLRSGEVMVIGGLMEQKSINSDNGVPYVSRVPYVGNLFKGVDKDDEMSELIIFIRATIVGKSGFTVDSDRNVYEKFFNDPRPLAF